MGVAAKVKNDQGPLPAVSKFGIDYAPMQRRCQYQQHALGCGESVARMQRDYWSACQGPQKNQRMVNGEVWSTAKYGQSDPSHASWTSNGNKSHFQI